MIGLIERIRAISNKEAGIKYKDHFDRLSASIYGKLQSPEMVEWFPAYKCNSHCQYCGGYDQEAIGAFEGTMPYEKIIKIVRGSGQSGAKVWNIGGRGGEPLLYPRLNGVLTEIKRQKMKGILITNGLLLKEDFLTELVAIEWDILRISLDSNLSYIHDEIRGVRGNFDKIDKALILLDSLKRIRKARFPNVICCPVITNKNYRNLSGYIDYCIERGVSEIQFMPLINVHERAGRLMLSNAQKRECVESLRQRIGEARIRHNIGFIVLLYNGAKEDSTAAQELRAPLYCIHLWKTLAISEDGYLSPCSLIKDKITKINNSCQKSWGSEEMNKLRKKILAKEFVSPLCKDCCGPLRSETHDFNNYLLKEKIADG